MNAFQVFMSLNYKRQIIAVVTILLTIAMLSLLVKQTLKPKMELLYSGLDSKIAGEVIAELAAKNVNYEVRGSAIYTPAAKRDLLRLELAKEGLPRQGVAGYELFDNMNGFSMTSDMFDTAYWRAKEGELARTILTLAAVDQVRVHLGTARRASFGGNPNAQSASVTIRSRGAISIQTAKAVQYLTALAVAGLDPSEVVVVDTKQGIVVGPGSSRDVMNAKMSNGLGELERAGRIKENLLTMLEARVGKGNARVSVMLDIDRTSESSTQRTFDPEGRVIISQSTRELTDTSAGKSLATSISSNLPDNGQSGNSTNSNRGDTTETVQYEVSELLKKTNILPGAIKRVSVAILINQSVGKDKNGKKVYISRSAEELRALKDLSLAAAGINTKRGDILSLKSMRFTSPELDELIEKPSFMNTFLKQYLWSIIKSAFLGIIVLVLGLFVLRPMLLGSGRKGSVQTPLLGQMDVANLTSSSKDGVGLPAPQPISSHTGSGEEKEVEANFITGRGDNIDPIQLLKNASDVNPDEVASLLSSWLETDSNNAPPSREGFISDGGSSEKIPSEIGGV